MLNIIPANPDLLLFVSSKGNTLVDFHSALTPGVGSRQAFVLTILYRGFIIPVRWKKQLVFVTAFMFFLAAHKTAFMRYFVLSKWPVIKTELGSHFPVTPRLTWT